MDSQSSKDLFRTFMELCTRTINLLQEEIDASELMNDALPALDEILPATEPIEEHPTNTESSLVPHGTPPKWAVQLTQFVSQVRAEMTPSRSRAIAEISRLELKEDGAFSDWQCTKAPPWPEMSWSGSMRPCTSHARQNALTQPPPPKPPNRNFKTAAMEIQVTGDSTVLIPPPDPPDGTFRTAAIVTQSKAGTATGTMSHICVNPLLILSCLPQYCDYYPLLNVYAPKNFWKDSVEVAKIVPVLRENGVPVYSIFQGKLGGVLIHGQVHTPEFITCDDEQMPLHDFYSKMGNMRTAQQVFDERAHMIVVSSESPFCEYLTAGLIAVTIGISLDTVDNSSTLGGNQIMKFCLCHGLHARKVSVNDTSQHKDMETRFFNGIAYSELGLSCWGILCFCVFVLPRMQIKLKTPTITSQFFYTNFDPWGNKFYPCFGVTQTLSLKVIDAIQRDLLVNPSPQNVVQNMHQFSYFSNVVKKVRQVIECITEWQRLTSAGCDLKDVPALSHIFNEISIDGVNAAEVHGKEILIVWSIRLKNSNYNTIERSACSRCPTELLYVGEELDDLTLLDSMYFGYVANEGCVAASSTIALMHHFAVDFNFYTLCFALNSCISFHTSRLASQVAGLVIITGYALDCVIGSILIAFYAKLGCITNAFRLIESLPYKELVTWSTLIADCARSSADKLVLSLFTDRLYLGLPMDQVVLSIVMKVYPNLAYHNSGRRVHIMLLEECLYVATEGQNLRCNQGVSNMLEEQKVLTGWTNRLELQFAELKIQQQEENWAQGQPQIKSYAKQASQLLVTEKKSHLQLTTDGSSAAAGTFLPKLVWVARVALLIYWCQEGDVDYKCYCLQLAVILKTNTIMQGGLSVSQLVIIVLTSTLRTRLIFYGGGNVMIPARSAASKGNRKAIEGDMWKELCECEVYKSEKENGGGKGGIV